MLQNRQNRAACCQSLSLRVPIGIASTHTQGSALAATREDPSEGPPGPERRPCPAAHRAALDPPASHTAAHQPREQRRSAKPPTPHCRHGGLCRCLAARTRSCTCRGLHSRQVSATTSSRSRHPPASAGDWSVLYGVRGRPWRGLVSPTSLRGHVPSRSRGRGRGMALACLCPLRRRR